MPAETVTVRMAEIGFAHDGAALKTTLGSCVGIIVRDRDRKVAGLAHVMLPRCLRTGDPPGKYADSAIPALLAGVESRGARRSALQAWIVGGARMFPVEDGGIGSIGGRNIEESRRLLAELGVPVIREEVGGSCGRTLTFEAATGALDIRTLAPVGGSRP
jgi:chemotaxis protein CheD